MSKLPILYSFRRCPYAMRARMSLLYSKITVEIREVALSDKPSELLAASAKGTVPVLVLPNGKVLEQSLEIMHWALAQNDPDNWLLADNKSAQTGAAALLEQNDSVFKPQLDKYKYAVRYPEFSQQYYRQQGEQYLHVLETQLGKCQYLFGSQLSWADIAIAPFVRQFAHVDLEWFENSEYRLLKGWLTAIESENVFIQSFTKFAFWTTGDSPTLLDSAAIGSP